MYGPIQNELSEALNGLRGSGLFKQERELLTAQQPHIAVAKGTVINFCANNYLGLANHPEVIRAAHEALDRWGY